MVGCGNKHWLVNWDNGANACGTFPFRFATEEEAQAYADDWVSTSTVEWDLAEDDELPSAEPFYHKCSGCEDCCTEECEGCAYCYEDPDDYRGMGWVGFDGRP
mgnify:CR=1 FL=1